MKNFLIQHLSNDSTTASAGILGCLAAGIDVQYECWDSMTVKALTPDKVEFLRHLFQSLIGSVTLKCDFAEKRTCRESLILRDKMNLSVRLAHLSRSGPRFDLSYYQKFHLPMNF